MGVPESKHSLGASPTPSTGSLRRSSLYKSGSLDEIQIKHDLVRSVKSDIEIFAGNRSDERYKELQQILVKTSADLEQIKRKTNKDRTRDRCNQVLAEVQACIRRLEEKLVLNEQSEKGLDLATIESNSFINQSFNKSVPGSQKYVNLEHVQTLDEIEFQIQNLEKEVKTAIELEDTKQFVILEKKITILYGDLVMVQIEDHTPLSERREGFERRLISCNNQIKKCRRRLSKRQSAASQISTSKLENSEDMDKTIQHLSELEIEVLTFEGAKTDKRYKELEQILERYWTKVYTADLFTDEERYKRDITIDKTKQILQELRKRAEDNEKGTGTTPILINLEQQIEELQISVKRFEGSSTDAEYTKLDQEARKLWASLNEIDETTEEAASKKEAAIVKIKNILKDLSQNTKKRESQTLEDIQQKQLLQQVDEFRIHWNQLNHNLSQKSAVESNISISIIEILEAVLESMKKKTRALIIMENRKSNASLVITKMTDNSDLHVIYKSAPDLVPQQLGIPEDAETKVPLSKTKIIAEMHRIGNDAKFLLQQIRQTDSTSDERTSFETKLKQCQTNLNSLEYNKKSDTIESNRRRVTKIIEEAFKALNEKAAFEQSRSKSALEIMDVDAEIYYWRQQIKNFSGVVKDKQYEKIKNGLAESLIKLQVLGDKNISKQESIQQIQLYHQELESKLAENQAKVKCAEIKRKASGEIKITVEQIQKLRAQVERFSGIYKGILYKQIENNLKSCDEKLEKLDTKNDERLENAKLQTQQKVRKYLTILEDKSTKLDKHQDVVNNVSDPQKPLQGTIVKETSPYQRVYSQELKQEKQEPQTTVADPELPHHKINALREKLVMVKENVESFSGRYKDAEFLKIQKEVEECLNQLKSVNDNGLPSVATSKAQYIDYVEKLQQYFEEKTLAQESAAPKGEDEV